MARSVPFQFVRTTTAEAAGAISMGQHKPAKQAEGMKPVGFRGKPSGSRMRTSVLAMGGSLAVALLVLTSCSSEVKTADTSFTKDAAGTLNAWAFDNADDVGKARLAHAAGELSGLTITMDATPFDAQKFTTRAASGNVPDVVQMDRSLVATYAAQGLIQPVDKCFSVHGMDPKKQFYPAVTEQVSYENQIWAVPQFFQPPAIILNKNVMDSAGVKAADMDTSDQAALLNAITQMYKSSGDNPSVLGFDPASTGQPELWLLGNGGRLVDDTGRPALDDPNNVKAIEYLKAINDAQGGYAKVKSFTDSFDTFGGGNQYVKNQVGAQINAQWYVNVLAPFADQVNISAVPFMNQDGKPFAVASGTAFVIPAGAKNANAACAWMVDLVTDDAWKAAGAARAETIAAKPGGINTGLFTGSPSADKLIRELYVKPTGNAGFDETIDTFYQAVEAGESPGASPAGQTIKTEVLNAITSSLLGEKTAQNALADAQAASMRAFDQVSK